MGHAFMADEDHHYTPLERYLISNQLRILEALYPNDAEGLAVTREALERGYEILYDWDTQHIFSGNEIMSRDECSEVWDTLEMFDAIDRAIEASGRPELRDEVGARFVGYDGNNESKFMSFAAFTVERLGRFAYVKLRKPGYWNSHFPARPMYQRMLSEWKEMEIQQRHELNTEALERILSAAPDPGESE